MTNKKEDTMTAKPQANKTIDEIVEELFEMGILTGIGKANIDVSGAKRLGSQSIKALIAEAKVADNARRSRNKN